MSYEEVDSSGANGLGANGSWWPTGCGPSDCGPTGAQQIREQIRDQNLSASFDTFKIVVKPIFVQTSRLSARTCMYVSHIAITAQF